MKKLLFALQAVLFLFLLTTANAQSKKSKMTAAKNLEMANGVNRAIMSGDLASLDKFIAADAIDHGGMNGDLVGLDAIRAELDKFHKTYPDLKFDIISESATDDYAFQLVHYTGTSAMEDMGMPAGTKMDMNAVDVVKLKDGKIVEHWFFMQPSDFMKMMPQSGQQK